MKVDNKKAENDKYGNRVFNHRQQKKKQCADQIRARHGGGRICRPFVVLCQSRIGISVFVMLLLLSRSLGNPRFGGCVPDKLVSRRKEKEEEQ